MAGRATFTTFESIILRNGPDISPNWIPRASFGPRLSNLAFGAVIASQVCYWMIVGITVIPHMWGIVSAMRELTFEVAIDQDSETSFLIRALKHLEIMNVLEFRSRGFLMLCRGSQKESGRFKELLDSDDSHNITVTILNKEKSGFEVLLVS